MKDRFGRVLCNNCKILFVPDCDDQEFCSFECKHADSEGKRRFISGDRNTSKIKAKRKHLKEQNEKWVEEKRKHINRKILPLREVVRRQEYNRVFGKGAWDHYCKGRKWDKI